ncbi:MAG TPA: hypothetical protein DDZ80_15555 [Cyanobacteria bacterium UBA8803]|nr:hypothetical protein [Cyanobacteria bacterium UBA8803]
MEAQIKPNSTRQIHKYVLILVGIWTLFAATLPIAYLRVSQSDKFSGTPFKSMNLEGQFTSPH